MNKLKQTLGIIILTVLFVPALALTTAPAANADINLWGDENYDTEIGKTAFEDFGDRDPRVIAGNVIKILLALLGVIAVVLILYGGFLWMTAMGNDDKVAKAKSLIGAGIIGLLVILAAYAITVFVLRSFLDATGAVYDQGQYDLTTN
ncbi:MAG: hypothetical protein V1865_00240 [bacterium]